jgi:hypothetical protein
MDTLKCFTVRMPGEHLARGAGLMNRNPDGIGGRGRAFPSEVLVEDSGHHQ